MFTIREFFKLLNQDGKILISSACYSRKINFDILLSAISKKVITEEVLCVIIYGSYLKKIIPNDVDCMVILGNDKKIDDKILIKKEEIKRYRKLIKTGDDYWDGSKICNGNLYETVYKGKWNPIKMDINIISYKVVKEELRKNREENYKDTSCYNALKKGCIIAKKENINLKNLFGIENEKEYIINKLLFMKNRWKISNNKIKKYLKQKGIIK